MSVGAAYAAVVVSEPAPTFPSPNTYVPVVVATFVFGFLKSASTTRVVVAGRER